MLMYVICANNEVWSGEYISHKDYEVLGKQSIPTYCKIKKVQVFSDTKFLSVFEHGTGPK